MITRHVTALWLPMLASLGSGLAVETSTPDALCPDLESTRAAVGARLGILDTDGRAGWRAVYASGHAPQKGSGDFVRLELFDPSGVLRLRRDLPRDSEPCAAMAQVIALVIDRYFRTLTDAERKRQTSAASASSSNSVSEPAKSLPPDVVQHPSVPSAETPVDTAGRPTLHPGVGFLSGAAGVFLFPSGLAAAELRFQARPARHFELGARVAIPLDYTSEAIGPGRAYLYTVPIRLGANWVVAGSRMQFAVGPDMLFSLEHGWTDAIPSTEDRYRLVLGLGLQSDARFWLTEQVGLVLAGGIDWVLPLPSSRFMVSGRDVLDSGMGRGFASIGVLIAWNGEAWNTSAY